MPVRIVCILLQSLIISLSQIALTLAQVIPDSKLGRENSTVEKNINVKNAISDLIKGGAIRDNNLFHSFTEFNVAEGSRVYFAHPDGIANIITRVTGENSSQIFGTLGVDGTANLFLLNPQGIVFGENAALDINGSFLASTGESFLFENGFAYSATNPEVPPLLTVNIPTGIQWGANAASIINHSRFSTDGELIRGLAISTNRTLSLLGGDVALEGGYLSTEAGNIEIGAVSPNSKVNLIPHTQGWQVGYQEVSDFADIKINRFGGIDGGEIGGSTITLTGHNISLGRDATQLAEVSYGIENLLSLEPLPNLATLPPELVNISARNRDNPNATKISLTAQNNLSLIESNIDAMTSGKGNGGEISAIAENIVIYNGGLESSTTENSAGNAGAISVLAENISVQNGGGGVNTFGSGNGGTMNFQVANDFKIQSGGFGAETNSTGNGGRLTINTRNLEVVSGGAGVNTLGAGDGGKITLNIAETLKITEGGFGADTVSTGNGGKIEINARHIDIERGGFGVNSRNLGKGGQLIVKAETISILDGGIGAESGQNDDPEFDFDTNRLQEKFGRKNAGDGGSISIEANSLLLDNTNIITSTNGTGNAGSINLKVNSLELTGEDRGLIASSTNALGNGGTIEIEAEDIIVSGNAQIAASSDNSGNAGDILIRTGNLIELRDKGAISVDGGITGQSGNINLTSDRVTLRNNSTISAVSNQGNEGNIILKANNLQLNSNSTIDANATGNSTGGDISIKLQDILMLQDKSKIIASAIDGEGGNINITARGIFTFPTTTIDASSQFGVDGTIQINNLSVDLNSSLIQLPSNLIKTRVQLARGCEHNDRSRFVYIGRGALPESILAPVLNEGLIADFGTNEVSDISLIRDPLVTNPPIVEAETWEIDSQGNLALTVSDRTHNSSIGGNHLNCEGKAVS